MDKKFKECNREQMFLLPPSPQNWLPEDHLVYFIIDVVGQLDPSEIYASYGGDGRGQPPYDPAMMVSLLSICLLSWCAKLSLDREGHH